MNILIIDNNSKHILNLVDLLAGHNLDIISREDIPNIILDKYHLIILSGGSHVPTVIDKNEYKEEINLCKHSKKPIIGICLGCEIIATAFDCTMKKLPCKQKGLLKVKFQDKEFTVYEAHRYAVDKISSEISVLGSSDSAPEIIKHKNKPIFGLQFHPEMFVDKTEGKYIFDQILNSCRNAF